MNGGGTLHPLLQRPLACPLLQALRDEARRRTAAVPGAPGAAAGPGGGGGHALPRADSVSLPRLAKRLGVGASAVLRELALMGDAALGGIPGPGWVCVHQEDGHWRVALTPAGQALVERLGDAAC